MITTAPRYAWIRIDGEPYKVSRADWDFLGLPVYIDPALPPGTVKIVPAAAGDSTRTEQS